MLTHARIRTLILASVVCGSHSLSAEEWKTLADEPSRADLFAQYIVPKTRPEEAQSFALLGPFVFPTDTTIDKTKNAARTDVIFGIDISHYEDASIRFDLMRDQNIRFVYVKATQGVGYKDGKFAQFWNAIGALPPEKKVLRGPYHFLASSGDPVAQADSFLKLLNENGGLKPGDLPPVLDLEWDKASAGGPDRWQGHSPDAILDAVLAWLGRVKEKTQRTPIVYTARAWWRERGIADEKWARLKDYRIWIADYSNSSRAVEIPAVPNKGAFDIWQFSETAQMASGYGGKLDANVYFGDDLKFLNDFQIK